MRKSSAARERKLSTTKHVLNACLESLEVRRLLATITVTSTVDTVTPNDGAITLREAITAINAGNDLSDPNITAQNPTAANAFGTKDTIDFNISGGGVQTIEPASPLPTLTTAVTIDGYSQPGASAATANTLATIEIEIDGENAGTSSTSVGLRVEGANVTIDGLAVNRFWSDGIVLVGSDAMDDLVWGNYLGVSPSSGTGAGNPNVGNGGSGVVIANGPSNDTIGGTSAADRNILSGNSFYGVDITGAGVGGQGLNQDDVVEGNYIGTDASGTIAIANDADGVLVDVARNITIGGTIAGSRNLISGNAGQGVTLSRTIGVTVEGNYIGTDVTGAKALGNGADGVYDFGSENDTVGGKAPGSQNIISGNGGNGVEGNNIIEFLNIQGNYIGTDVAGTKAIGNHLDGVVLDGGSALGFIGGSDVGAGNLISGNGANGIDMIEAGSSGVKGNLIGTDVSGALALPNSGNGVQIQGGSFLNSVGGQDAGARNIISGNSGFGVAIDGTGAATNETTENFVEGNYIGTDATGEIALGDGNAGVYIDKGADDNTIGGTEAGARNIISGIAGAGVYISGIEINFSGGSPGPTRTNSNTVEGNYIGTDATGTEALQLSVSSNEEAFAYTGAGVYLDQGAFNNTIGGLTSDARNLISGNRTNGVYFDTGATSNTLEGNYIGVEVTGSNALGNGFSGVVAASDGNIIGGTSAAARNVISGNGTVGFDPTDAGVEIAGANLNLVQGNFIGTDATGTAAVGNIGAGVMIDGEGHNNTIGGNIAAAANVIANNGKAGVAIIDAGVIGGDAGGPFHATGNTIRLNSIYANKGLGIDLDNDGITANDPQDPDLDGPNNLQNYPVLVTAASTGSSVTISGTFNSLPGTNFTLDFYATDTIDAHGNSQGKQYLGSVGVVTDVSGNATINSTFNVAIGSNKYITATATNESTAPYGDTSEFSQAVEATDVTPPPPPVAPTLSIGNVSMNEGNSGTSAFTFTVTRSGDTSGTSTVQFNTADGTASSSSDYTANNGTVTFAAGQTIQTVTVNVKGDTTVESDETFFVNLSIPVGATIANGKGTGTIKNDDSAPPPPPASKVSIITDPCDSTKKALEIDGTNNSDTITVTKSGSAQGKAVVKINGVNKGTFSFSGSIVVYGNGGSDNISIDSAITRSAYIWGGDGNDTVNGGGGNDLVFGQAGDDSLNGNGGRDILVGGDGTDKLNGGSGDDLLIAGDFKSTLSMSQLCSIQKEWDRTDKNYSSRLKDLSNGGGFNSIKLSSSTLFSSTTLKDSLTGGADSDVFFAATTGDKITDKASGETAVNIG